MFQDFLTRRRTQHAQERFAAAAASSERQAGSMTRGERDTLRRRPVRVVGPTGSGPFGTGGIPTHTDPAKAAAKAAARQNRDAAKAARRSQSRGR